MLYDPESNIICWELAKGEIDHVREVGNVIIHVSKTEKPILIEILDASSFIGQFDKLKEIKEFKKIIPTT